MHHNRTQVFEGRLTELRLDENRERTLAWISCPPRAVPAPGRYLLAWAARDREAPMAAPLFAAQSANGGFLAAPPIPEHWMPGERLYLRGPLGHGFELPRPLHRLALACFGEGVDRLLPLAALALEERSAVAIFSNVTIPKLPLAVEVNPLSALPEAVPWADFLALDLPLERLSELQSQLGLGEDDPIPTIQTQALITTPMPCGGIAECGACALPSGKTWKLTCKDGPVFALKDLLIQR
jgi:hypothetical protein